MIIHHLTIANFRGIRALEWHLNGRFLCLIGPNDATKTTILEAIELVSLSRYNAYVSEADFHLADTSKPILIEATFGEIPPSLLDESNKFGLFLRGYNPITKTFSAAPENGLIPVFTVRFEVDENLEPNWSVVRADGETKRIIWQDRERLGVNHLGREIDRHLTWGRGSALSKLTDQSGAPTAKIVAAVTREANRIFGETDKQELNDAASSVQQKAAEFGAAFHNLKPGLDVGSVSFGSSAFGLQESSIPARFWGLGTKRLVALAIQQKGVGSDSVLLIDELETGLEPHRVRHLVDCLLNPEKTPRGRGQVIFTTHSPSAVIPLPVESLRFVRSKDGITQISEVQPACLSDMQGYSRRYAHALFGRKVLVCEGATEEGLCRGLMDSWIDTSNALHPTHVGFVLANGGGRTAAPKLAIELKRVGYDVAVLADSDEPLEPSASVLGQAGIPVFIWDGSMATEQRISSDLPLLSLQEIIDKAVELAGEDGKMSIRDQVQAYGNFRISGDSVSGWIAATNEADVRAAIGKAAKKKGWFKDVTQGEWLGNTVGKNLGEIDKSPLEVKLSEVLYWIYDI